MQRYSSCIANFKTILKRKLEKRPASEGLTPQEKQDLINSVTQKIIDFGYLNDEIYALLKFRSGFAQGKSARAITFMLKQKGVEQETSQSALLKYKQETYNNETSTDDLDLEAAITLAKKKKLGIYHPSAPIEIDLYQKHLARLARAGFSYEACKKALTET